MDPKIWGYSGWVTLYSIICKYPEYPDAYDTHYYKRFFDQLRYVLPCKTCCMHYESHCSTIKIDSYLSSRNNFINWLLDINNNVNISKNVPLYTLDSASAKYNINLRTCKMNDNNNIMHNIWKFLFAICIAYPKNPSYNDILNYKNFFVYLKDVIPNAKFKALYEQHIVYETPVDKYLINSKSLVDWLIILYNKCNNTEYNNSQILDLFFNKDIKNSIIKRDEYETFTDNTLSSILILTSLIGALTFFIK